ncbi:MAG: hypothetical protein RLZZ528_1074, partial [Pseudomonadota bacterium]
MKRFAGLFAALDATTSTNAKVAALAAYFRTAPDADRLWTVALLSGRRPRRTATTTELRAWAAEAAGLPDWLFEDSYAVAGDLAETIALVLPAPATASDANLTDWIDRIRTLAGQDAPTRKAAITDAWSKLDGAERFLFNKLLTGGFRMGVSQALMTRALSQATGMDEASLQHRLMGDWDPARTSLAALLQGNDDAGDSRPYPFFLAHALEGDPATLGEPSDWLAEWKWDGIRGQLVLRDGAHHLWSRGEELMTDRFPEFAQLADFVPPGTVIDGEVLAFRDGAPLAFADLQKRIGRKSVPKTLLADAPVILMAYDLLEAGGQDLRSRPLAERRNHLETLVKALPPQAPVRLS